MIDHSWADDIHILDAQHAEEEQRESDLAEIHDRLLAVVRLAVDGRIEHDRVLDELDTWQPVVEGLDGTERDYQDSDRTCRLACSIWARWDRGEIDPTTARAELAELFPAHTWARYAHPGNEA